MEDGAELMACLKGLNSLMWLLFTCSAALYEYLEPLELHPDNKRTRQRFPGGGSLPTSA